MNSIILTKETVAQYTDFLVNPKKYGCDYKPMKECFTKSDHYEPQHLLYNQYINYIQKPLPKLVFYIIMQEQFPNYYGKDTREGTRHDFGYKLKLNI